MAQCIFCETKSSVFPVNMKTWTEMELKFKSKLANPKMHRLPLMYWNWVSAVLVLSSVGTQNYTSVPGNTTPIYAACRINLHKPTAGTRQSSVTWWQWMSFAGSPPTEAAQKAPSGCWGQNRCPGAGGLWGGVRMGFSCCGCFGIWGFNLNLRWWREPLNWSPAFAQGMVQPLGYNIKYRTPNT